MHGKRTARCESEKNGRTHRRILDDQCCTYRNLPKVFLYLLSMIIIYYNDFTLIYDVYYTSSSISLSYSQNIVSEQYPRWSTCQCYCSRRIRIIFCLINTFRANLRSKQADSVVSNAQNISFF